MCSVGVGKIELLLRYANESFSPTFITTIGLDFKIKNIVLDGMRIKIQVRRYGQAAPNHFLTILSVQIWDSAGQERFRTITTSYFRGKQGIVMVYDITDRATFVSIRNWAAQIAMVRVMLWVPCLIRT